MRKGIAGAVERFVQSVKRIVRRVTGRDVSGWDDAQVFGFLCGLDSYDAGIEVERRERQCGCDAFCLK